MKQELADNEDLKDIENFVGKKGKGAAANAKKRSRSEGGMQLNYEYEEEREDAHVKQKNVVETKKRRKTDSISTKGSSFKA